MVHEYWQKRYDKESQTFECKCGKRLRKATSNTDKNPLRDFVGCSNRDGRDGCGFFCWLDEEPKAFGGAAVKRPRTTEFVASSDAPNLQAQVANLGAEIARLNSVIASRSLPSTRSV